MGKLESAAVTAAPTGLKLFSRPKTIVEETSSPAASNGRCHEQTTCFEDNGFVDGEWRVAVPMLHAPRSGRGRGPPPAPHSSGSTAWRRTEAAAPIAG